MTDEAPTATADGGCSCGYRAGSRPTQIGCGNGQCPHPTTRISVAPMPWPPAEAAKMRDHARWLFGQHTSHADKLARDNCGACALGRYSELHQPNYVGWLRLWIAAGRLLPELPYKQAMRDAAAIPQGAEVTLPQAPTLREWVIHELDRMLQEPSPAIRLSIATALRRVAEQWPNVTYMGQAMEDLLCTCGHPHADHGDGVVHTACCAVVGGTAADVIQGNRNRAYCECERYQPAEART